MAYDFSIIGRYMAEYMDTDEMDVDRAGLTTLPDGSIAPAEPRTPLYSGIKCHVSRNQSDSPDPTAVGGVPIVFDLTVNCGVDVDLQNGDYVTVRKLDAAGRTLEQYEGTIGAPSVNQGRQEAIMAVRQAAAQ